MLTKTHRKGAHDDRHKAMREEKRKMLRLRPLAPIEEPANEKCQEADEKHDRGHPQPVAQHVARLSAHVRRAALDEGHLPASILADILRTGAIAQLEGLRYHDRFSRA